MKQSKKHTMQPKLNEPCRLNAPRPMINGLMLDPARIPLRFEWYERFIPWMARWGYSTLLLNLADDTGCAIRLQCRPELSTHAALTHAQIRRLVDLATAHNINLVPIIATLGHTGYIHFHPSYRHLGDGLSEPGRNVLCPARAESKKILAEIVKEVMGIFPSQYIHIGLDEAGELPKKTCRYCRKKFAGWKEPDFVVDYMQWLSALAARRGKNVMYWALNQWHKERDQVITAGAPASAIGCVWQYDEMNTVYTDDTAIKFFIKARRQVIGVPALGCSPNTTILPNQHNLDNIRRFATVIHKHKKHLEVRGLINSVWQHTYALPGTLIYGMAYAADQFKQPGGTPDFPKLFTRDFFGASTGAAIGKLLRDLHACAPRFRDLHNLIECAKPEDIQAVTALERRAAIAMGRRAQKIAAGLRKARKTIAQNHDIYDAFILAADILTHIGDRAVVLAGAHPKPSALRRLARQARALADAAWRNWDTALDPAHPCRKMRFPPPGQPPRKVNISQYCYFGAAQKHSNKHIFRSLEKSAVFLHFLHDQGMKKHQGATP